MVGCRPYRTRHISIKLNLNFEHQRKVKDDYIFVLFKNDPLLSRDPQFGTFALYNLLLDTAIQTF